MFSRAPLVKQAPVAKAAAPAKQAPEYFSTEEAAEVGAPEYSYSLAGLRMFAIGEDEAGSGGRHSSQSLPLPIQAKLEVGAVDDPLEREADHTAETVMRTSVAQTATPVLSKSASAAQRKCACGGACEKCKAEQEDKREPLQRKPAGPDALRQTAAPPIVHEIVNSPGKPLDPTTRSYMEPRFGHDLSKVRLHADSRAAESARKIRARAYTVGHQIVFGEGQLAPATQAGRRLLAHELTHVLQQSGNQYGAGDAKGGRVSHSAAPANRVQRDAVDSMAAQVAREIDENAWSEPNPYRYIRERFDDLSQSTEDNVGAAFIKLQADSGRLNRFAASAEGRRTLDVLYDAVITGDVSDFEREQAGKIVEAKGKNRPAPDRATLSRLRDPMIFPIANQHYFSDCYATLQAKLLPSGRVRVYYDTVRVFRCEEFRKEMNTLFRHHSRDEILNGFELDSDEMVGVKLFDEDDEPITYVPAIMLIDFSNRQNQDTLGKIKTVAIMGATAGLGGLGGAGALAWADRVAFVLTAASSVINDYRHEIMKSAGGRKFLSVWKYVDATVQYYGWARLGVDGVRLIKSRVGPALNEWRAETPPSELSSAEQQGIKNAQEAADNWLHAADDVEAAAAEKYINEHPPHEIEGDVPGKRRAKLSGDHEVEEVPTPDGIACEFHSPGRTRVKCPKGLGTQEEKAGTGTQKETAQKSTQEKSADKATQKKTAAKAARKETPGKQAQKQSAEKGTQKEPGGNAPRKETVDEYLRRTGKHPRVEGRPTPKSEAEVAAVPEPTLPEGYEDMPLAGTRTRKQAGVDLKEDHHIATRYRKANEKIFKKLGLSVDHDLNLITEFPEHAELRGYYKWKEGGYEFRMRGHHPEYNDWVTKLLKKATRKGLRPDQALYEATRVLRELKSVIRKYPEVLSHGPKILENASDISPLLKP